jgi:hypothetical protein
MKFWDIEPDDKLGTLTARGRAQLTHPLATRVGCNWFFTADGGMNLTIDQGMEWKHFGPNDTVGMVQEFCNGCKAIDYQI